MTAHYTEHRDDGVGIRCGNGLIGLDVDHWDGGQAALADLEPKHGPLPATPTVITGSGSRHYWLRGQCASRNLRSIGIDGIEIKGTAGCQLVAPPSLHPDTGRLYCWDPAHPLIEREIAPAPAWLLELAGVPPDRDPSDPSEYSDLQDRDPLHRIASRVYIEN